MRFDPRDLRQRTLALVATALLAACGQTGSLTDTGGTIADRDLSAIAGPTTASQLRPVERVPRSQYAVVNPAPLGERDMPAFVYPSLDADERASLLAGLVFFTTPHTASEGLGPTANQTRCMGCHLSGDDNQADLLTTNSHITRAARATPTNFRYTAFDPATGGGRPADHLDALTNTGRTAAFTIFGNYSPSGGTFEPLAGFSGFVQHTRPSIPACLPDPILPVAVDPMLRGGIDPATGLSPLGLRRAASERAGPPYVGRGLMEAIPAEELIQNDDPTDSRDSNSSLRAFVPRFPECPGDCISGRHNENTSNQAFTGGDPVVRVGRFGLRGAGPTILQFVVGGIQGELGFTTEFVMTEINDNVNVGRPGCIDTVPEPEIPVTDVLSCRQLVRLTAPPEFGEPLLAVLRASDPNAPRTGQEGLVQRGAQLFGIDLVAFANRMIPGRMPGGGDGRDRHAINQADRGVNCAGCHTPVQTTGSSPAQVGGRHLSNVWAPIFSDLLLHEGPEVTPERNASTPRDPVVITRNGFRTLDLSRNLSDDVLPNQGVANGKEFRTPPLMAIGRVGPPFFHDARVFLSRDSRDSFPLGTVYSDATVTNAPLVVRSFDDALRAAIELHDLPAPDDERTPSGGGCPVPAGGVVGEVRYSGAIDICPPYNSETSRRNRSEAREVIRRFRALTASDQQAIIEFLKQL
ncbi:MAG TPA: lipoprotein [Vicinamibacteria bacterium]|nr:lipoprotein [Vicinamibacteria bacterium]